MQSFLSKKKFFLPIPFFCTAYFYQGPVGHMDRREPLLGRRQQAPDPAHRARPRMRSGSVQTTVWGLQGAGAGCPAGQKEPTPLIHTVGPGPPHRHPESPARVTAASPLGKHLLLAKALLGTGSQRCSSVTRAGGWKLHLRTSLRGRGMQPGCVGKLPCQLETPASGYFRELFVAQALALGALEKLRRTDGALGFSLTGVHEAGNMYMGMCLFSPRGVHGPELRRGYCSHGRLSHTLSLCSRGCA